MIISLLCVWYWIYWNRGSFFRCGRFPVFFGVVKVLGMKNLFIVTSCVWCCSDWQWIAFFERVFWEIWRIESSFLILIVGESSGRAPGWLIILYLRIFALFWSSSSQSYSYSLLPENLELIAHFYYSSALGRSRGRISDKLGALIFDNSEPFPKKTPLKIPFNPQTHS